MTTETGFEDLNTQLGKTQQEISNIIETFIHLGVQVHDFKATDDAKLGLANNINKVINQLKSLESSANESSPSADTQEINNDTDDVSNKLSEINIPLEVLNYIEDGRNPDIYTREFIEVVRKINQYLNGKSIAFNKFKNILSSKIIKEFPDLQESVNEIKFKTDLN
ncbi:hypothetical protein B5S28_g2108 [[Candida] boidinii]|nr:hypothetical protein B5S28_g2108 [[Candida] boidinii]OWB61853.1 hypothetical protein B5S29_g2757 [[Candida] boidinii]OWB75138.1 hypothetical protein B5S31_g4997 [[Candida] boidinii]OWB78635.1 hypothetical protein B5S32_g2833 [[Candida] boidinii]